MFRSFTTNEAVANVVESIADAAAVDENVSRLAPVRTNRLREFYRRHMELTQSQWDLTAPHLPVQRGNEKIPNLQILNAILYII